MKELEEEMSFIKFSTLYRCRVRLVKNETIMKNILRDTSKWWKTDYDRIIFLCEKCKQYVRAMNRVEKWLGRTDHSIVSS